MEATEAAAKDVVTELDIELQAEGIIDNHRTQVDDESKNEMWENSTEPIGFKFTETVSKTGVEPPGEEWSCKCAPSMKAIESSAVTRVALNHSTISRKS